MLKEAAEALAPGLSESENNKPTPTPSPEPEEEDYQVSDKLVKWLPLVEGVYKDSDFVKRMEKELL